MWLQIDIDVLIRQSAVSWSPVLWPRCALSRCHGHPDVHGIDIHPWIAIWQCKAVRITACIALFVVFLVKSRSPVILKAKLRPTTCDDDAESLLQHTSMTRRSKLPDMILPFAHRLKPSMSESCTTSRLCTSEWALPSGFGFPSRSRLLS